jgi:hypothetical protein
MRELTLLFRLWNYRKIVFASARDTGSLAIENILGPVNPLKLCDVGMN